MARVNPRPSHGRGRIHEFQELMRRRVEHILLVSSPYDCFILEEDGRLNERILGEFLDLGLRHTPLLTRVSTGAEALSALSKDSGLYDLIITSMKVGEMSAVDLALAVQERGLDLPVVLLAYDSRELHDFMNRNDTSAIDRIFLWQGDVRILLGIAKYVEDKLNVEHDSGEAGVPLVLVVEDNVRYYSSFLPLIYTELVKHAQTLLSEGINLSHQVLRMRARPKLLLASTYEEAWNYFTTYQDNVLGVISDIEFPRATPSEYEAGLELAMMIRRAAPDIPIVLQSSKPENEAMARSIGAPFLLKGSPTLLTELRRCLVEYFGFGDFVFRLPDGSEVARASDLRSLLERLHSVPAASIQYHGERNHFSKWLRARAEFALAHRLRPRQMSDYAGPEAVRADLLASIVEYRRDQALGTVADFKRQTFDPAGGGFWRLGGGSIGGKARGLAFVRRLCADFEIGREFPGMAIGVPSAVVVATDVFEQFLEENGLADFCMTSTDDAEIHRRIMDARFPEEARQDLAAFLAQVNYPLAIRSSSLLEDSQYQPFTGVYETYMLPNNHPVLEVRLEQLLRAIKGVYGSMFTQHAKAYLRATPYRLEEEKMAVILQRIVGAPCSDRYYPDFSGVARSYNFYPNPPLTPQDGIVAIALGLGRMVVDGGNCLRFSPRYPRHVVQFSSVGDMLENSQRQFWALALRHGGLGMDPDHEMREVAYDLSVAEKDGTLSLIGSTWSPENEAIYDGLSRPGVRLVTFAPMLKHELFPLAEILNRVLDVGSEGMGGPVEIEFAVNLRVPPGQPKEFGFLQMRPLAMSRELEELEIEETATDGLICRCSNVLGNGRMDDIRDIVVIDYERFDRARSVEAAAEVAHFNAELVAARTPYILFGSGRWGSTDPWLGIPVTWDQIAGARVIVESGFKNFRVQPSQGTHFFQNLTSFQVGYFTVNPLGGDGFIDWEWLAAQPAVREGMYFRRITLPEPAVIKMNGTRREGVILKPRLA